MGKVIFPNWDKRRGPTRPRRRLPIGRRYLGYGHWLVFFENKVTEIRFVSTPQARALFYRAKSYTEDGFPCIG